TAGSETAVPLGTWFLLDFCEAVLSKRSHYATIVISPGFGTHRLEKGPCGIVVTIAPSRKTRCEGKWLPVSLVVTLTVGPLQSRVPEMACQMNQDKRGQTA